MLYRWRSLESAVRTRLKTRGIRLKPKTWEYQRTPDCRDHQSWELIKNLHTYTESKYHPRANKFQSKTFLANYLATWEHNPELQYTVCPKSHQTHWHLNIHYWTLHFTPEGRNPAPPTRTLPQASLTRKPWQATHPTPPTARNLHSKEEPQTARMRKGHHKRSNINKMKRQRNTQQVKEQDKCPWNKRGRDMESTW